MSGWAGRVHDFIGVLRQNRIPVSVHETMDALRAVEAVGLRRPARLQAALRATLVKDPSQLDLFDELFGLYFHAPAGREGDGDGGGTGDGGAAGDQSAGEDGEGDDGAEAAAGAPDAQGGGPPGAGGGPQSAGEGQPGARGEATTGGGTAERIMAGDRTALEIDIRRAGEAVGIRDLRNFWQEGFFNYRILEFFDDNEEVRQNVRRAIEAARRAGDAGAAAELEQRLRDFEVQVRDYVRRELRQRDLMVRARFRRDMLMERSFYRASQDELAQIRNEVRRLAEKLKARVNLRRKRARRGVLHVQETVRANLQTGVVPFHLRFRRKPKNKPELVVFFDMSESVRAVSEFTLMFVHSLADLFQRVRLFAFVADTAEVTDLMRTMSFDDAFKAMMSSKVLSIYRHSDYGEAIRQWHQKYGDAITPRSTVIVLGDARGNYQPHEPELLQDMVMRAKWSLWLNPEPRGSWGLGDSVMRDYEPFFRATATVSNLKQLENVIEKLVLRF